MFLAGKVNSLGASQPQTPETIEMCYAKCYYDDKPKMKRTLNSPLTYTRKKDSNQTPVSLSYKVIGLHNGHTVQRYRRVK